MINNIEYNLQDFYIVYNNSECHLLCTDNRYQNENIEYDKSVKLIDTTAFIKLINKCEIKENTIIVKDDTLNDFINNWDYFLHDKVSQTDAIANKKMIGND